MEPWSLLQYTQYIQCFSMFIQIYSFLAFIVSQKSVTKIFKNGKIWKPMKGYNSKSYGPLATILPQHLPYLRDQVWYKFHRSRTTNIKVIEQKCILMFWKPTKGHNSKSYEPLTPILGNTIHPVIFHVYTNFQLSSFHSSWEICYKNFQEWQNLKTYEGTEIPRVMDPWPPFCYCIFLS